MGETTITVRIEDELEAAFQAAAAEEASSGADVLERLMRDYVAQHSSGTAYDFWFKGQVDAGLASARAGRLVASEQVEALFAARRAKTQAALDKKSK